MDNITNAIMTYLATAADYDADTILASFGGVAVEVVEGEITDGSEDCDWGSV